MMPRIMRNLMRVLLLLPYPLLVLFIFYLLYRKQKYKEAIKKNYKTMIVNTIIVLAIAVIGFTVFFKLEDTIYDFDYVGHWYRALIMKEKFFTDPFSIPEFLHHSLNYDVYYSYLTAFFQIPIVLVKESYGFFSLGSFIMFFIPSFVCLQILYFSYFDEKRKLPVFIALIFYPLYIVFLNGETECFGFLMLLMCYMLTLFVKFDEIDMMDNLAINIFAFLLIFGRRFYLYALIMMYACYFIHYLNYYKFKPNTKRAVYDFGKIISSGLLLLILCLTVYYPFFLRVVTNNYDEIYAYNNKPGKINAFVSMFSPIVLLISCYGVYILARVKKKYVFCACMIIMLILPTAMFWQVQSFERHHYYMIAFPILVFFTQGLYCLFKLNKNVMVMGLVGGILLLQTAHVFLTQENIFPFNTPHQVPKIYDGKNEVIEFYDYLSTLCSDGSYVFMATGDGNLNYSTLMNSRLPELPSINIEERTNEIIDGFPDLKNIRYVVLSDPITYSSQEYQHMYEIITEAITNEEEIGSLYSLLDEREINGVTYYTYSLDKPYLSETKSYFYKKMIEIYPDKSDFFQSILE